MEDEKKKKKNKKKKNKQTKTPGDVIHGVGESINTDENRVSEENPENHLPATADGQTDEPKTDVDVDSYGANGTDRAGLEERIKELQKENDVHIQKEASSEETLLKFQKDNDEHKQKEASLEETIARLQTENCAQLEKGASLEMKLLQLQSEKDSWIQKEVGFEVQISQLMEETAGLNLKGVSFEEKIKQLERERVCWIQKEEAIPVTEVVSRNCCSYSGIHQVKVTLYLHFRMEGVEDIEVVASASNSSQHVYTPQVKNEFIPKIGQHFDNLDEVHSFYNNYGREGGFGTRLNSSKKSKDGEIIRKEYVCYKEGVRKLKINKTAHTVRRRGLTREGCGARVVVVKDRSDAGGFLVRHFVEGHNHPLTTPRKVHLLHSHRAVTVAKRNLTQQLSNANVPTWQQMSILEMDAGGLENVGCTLRDLYNAERDRRKALKGHDATLLFEHFKDEKKKNPGFTFEFEQDEGVMVHCFWADTTCRKAYKYFGDVVVFDTTYNTNRYKLIFAPMVGVNHHGQTTLLGCAFLSGEKIDAFDWFFKQWLKAMPGGPPKMIITDQDPAIGNAIRTVLPNTFHRYCIWHILTKFSEKISPISYKEHYDEFSKCIWKSESPEEFEGRWAEVVAKIDNNEWLNSLYQIRERWVPAYSRHIFSAHMTSSQRVEGAHAFFKKYVSPQNSMLDFVTRFNRGLSKMRHNELDADHKDVNEKPQTVTGRVMESQMSELYTLTIFYKFQEQLVESGKYVVKSTFKDDRLCLYNVRRVPESDSKGRELTVDKSSNFVKCSCKMFESDGIPCRHMLTYFSKKQVMELPEQYILRRWTKAAKAGRVMDDLGGTVNEICDTSLVVRRNSLFQLASNVIDEAVLSEDDTEELTQILLEAKKRIAAKKRGKEAMGGKHGTEDVGEKRVTEDVREKRVTEDVQRKRGIEDVDGSHGSVEEGQLRSVNMPFSLESQHSLKEPFPVRTKGCGKRLKGGKEKAVKMKKGRRCNGCGLMNQSHDKRNCPKLLGISSQNVRLNDEEELDDEDDEEDEEDIVLESD